MNSKETGTIPASWILKPCRSSPVLLKYYNTRVFLPCRAVPGGEMFGFTQSYNGRSYGGIVPVFIEFIGSHPARSIYIWREIFGSPIGQKLKPNMVGNGNLRYFSLSPPTRSLRDINMIKLKLTYAKPPCLPSLASLDHLRDDFSPDTNGAHWAHFVMLKNYSGTTLV